MAIPEIVLASQYIFVFVLYVVLHQAEAMLAERKLDKEYLPISGLPAFTGASARLAFGADSPVIKDKLVRAAEWLGSSRLLLWTAVLEMMEHFYWTCCVADEGLRPQRKRKLMLFNFLALLTRLGSIVFPLLVSLSALCVVDTPKC